MAEEESLN